MTTIDLTNPTRRQENLLTDYRLKLPSKRSFLGYNKTSQWTLNIRIVHLEHEGIVVRNEQDLIKLKIGNLEGSDLTLDVTSQDLYFSTFIDTGEVLDCEEMETDDNREKSYAIRYQVEYRIISRKNSDSRKVATESGKEAIFEHKIQFSGIRQMANISFRNDPVEYSVVGEQEVVCGKLDMSLQHLFRRAPYLNMEFSLSVVQNAEQGAVIRQDIAYINRLDITEQGAYFPTGTMNLRPDGVEASILTTDYDPVTRIYRIGNFYVNGDHHVYLPVMWNLSAIKNPREKSECYMLVLKGQMWGGEDENDRIDFREEFPVMILRNSKQTDLNVQIVIPSALAEPEKFVMIPGEDGSVPVFRAREILVNGGTARNFYLMIGNAAEAPSVPGAAVRIKNFRLSGPLYPEGVEAKSEKKPFDIETGQLSEFASELTNLEYGQQDSILIRYRANAITGFTKERATCFETEARFDFSFSYVVDMDGSQKSPQEGDFKRFSGTIVLPLSVAPKAEWMCVDFGTSAVVAEYGKSIYDEQGNLADNLVDLRKKKTLLLRKTFAENEKTKRIDKNESDTEFISSMCAFNWLGDVSAFDVVKDMKSYKDSAIWFSPSTSMINPDYQLPCLKSLMGYETLPKGIFPQAFEQDIAGKAVSKVNNIYEVVYRQLFKYYIPADIEKIVFTIPNTFAPIHLKMLRQIAIDSVPTLRKSRIRFVSESDAVAYYYLSHRNTIMQNSSISHREMSQIDEYTLVYDMGAGTLDLTYFMKRESPQTTEIEIKGKMGVNKAGNYMDYLIAEILADLLTKRGKKLGKRISQLLVLDKTLRDASIQNSECNELKSYVRDQVKPALNTPEKNLEPWSLDADGELREFTGSDILGHEKFETFLAEITDGVFNNFAALFGDNHKIAVGLIIFSGRSTSLGVIRNKIINTISKYNTRESCRFVDIAAEKFVTQGEAVDLPVVKRLKSVVAAGALAYPTIIVKDESDENRAYRVRNRNVYATYGIMAHTARGWQWYPLIDAKTRPTTAPVSVYGMEIFCYDSSRYSVRGEFKPLRLPFGNIDSIYVLQSYSEDTQKDWENGNKEMITILCWKTMENYTSEEDVALKITPNNEIVLWIGAAPTEMYAHDDFHNISFRKSMWPVIFNSEQK